MSLQQAVLLRFKHSLEDFFSELIDMFPNETEFTLAKVMMSTTLSPKALMDAINTGLSPTVRDMIKQRHSAFFITHNFFGFNSMRLGEIWSTQLSEDVQESIWIWIDHFVDLVNKYNEYNF